MKASHYLKEVKKSKAFKSFIEECPDAYLCSMFFIRDFSGNQNETQVDFYSPTKKDITSFKIGKIIERVPFQKKALTLTHKKIIPKQLAEDIKMDLDSIKPTLTDEMHNRDMTYEIEKILAVLNVTDDRPVWNCTGFLKGLGLLQAHVEDQSQSILFMEKKSLLDMVRFSGNQGMGIPGMQQPGLGQPGAGTEVESGIGGQGGSIKVISPQELVAELKKEKAAAKQAEKEEKHTTKTEKQTEKEKSSKQKSIEGKKKQK